MIAASIENIQQALAERGLSLSDLASVEVARRELGAGDEELEELFGHGPIRSLLEDPEVTEILLNGPGEIWAERAGTLQRVGGSFSSEESLRRYVRRLLAPHGRKVDPRAPFADAVIENGIRVHVAVPPVSKKGICVSLRKPPGEPWSLVRLVERGAMTEATASFLREAVLARRNIFVCGGTGTGKTSLLGALLGEIPPEERVLALEDVAELRVPRAHFLSLEARAANQEGEGEICLSRLLREALRMRPDRLVIGECRGVEALDLVMALHTGHRGSFGTIHANSPRDALQRLEMLVLLAAENLRESAVKTLISSAVQLVVFVERGAAGRRVASIAEVRGVEGSQYLLRDIKLS